MELSREVTPDLPRHIHVRYGTYAIVRPTYRARWVAEQTPLVLNLQKAGASAIGDGGAVGEAAAVCIEPPTRSGG